MSIKNISLHILIPIISCYPGSGNARVRSHGSSHVGRHSDSNFLSNLFSGRKNTHHAEEAETSASPTTSPANSEPASPTPSPADPEPTPPTTSSTDSGPTPSPTTSSADSRSTSPTTLPADSGQNQTPATTSKLPDTSTKSTTASTSSTNQEQPPTAPSTSSKTSKNRQSSCIIKTVMADDDYYSCGTVPPSYTVRIWPR